jgi:hypothetical protein
MVHAKFQKALALTVYFIKEADACIFLCIGFKPYAKRKRPILTIEVHAATKVV